VTSQSQLIDDLLDLSRMQTGKLSLHREEVRLDEMVERIAHAVAPDAQAKEVALSLKTAAGDYALQADPVRIEQIIWNLASNALKFTPAGGSVEIRLSAAKDTLRLEVADTGRGIEPRFLPHVFEMFQQADARSTTRGKGGLGIGLALVKRLAEAHGGQVRAESAGLGQGAAFTVVLPRAPAGSPQERPGPDAAAVRGKRILLVDDEQETLRTFGALLEAEGAEITVAASAEEALGHAAPGRFDLVVSDIAMPGMDGYALLARLREAGLQGVPAIAVTGFAQPGDRERALAAGFDEHLGKPLKLSALVRAIGRLDGNY
jgi:two-component system CheB/CheR fusion protein